MSGAETQSARVQPNAPLKSAWRGEMFSTPNWPLERACSTVLYAYVGGEEENGREDVGVGSDDLEDQCILFDGRYRA